MQTGVIIIPMNLMQTYCMDDPEYVTMESKKSFSNQRHTFHSYVGLILTRAQFSYKLMEGHQAFPKHFPLTHMVAS